MKHYKLNVDGIIEVSITFIELCRCFKFYNNYGNFIKHHYIHFGVLRYASESLYSRTYILTVDPNNKRQYCTAKNPYTCLLN